jgi:hypothetical protein
MPMLGEAGWPFIMYFYGVFALGYVGVPVILFYAGRRALRALERRSVSEAELAALTQRVAALEERLEAVAGETDNLAEGQRFTTALLSERPGAGGHR